MFLFKRNEKYMSIAKHSNNTEMYKIKSESPPFKLLLPEVTIAYNLKLGTSVKIFNN